jgi:cell wall-associated NlpC family hydrolase
VPASLSGDQPVNGFPKRQLVTLVILLPAIAGVLVLARGATADPTINAKRAEAQRAWDEIQQMDIKLEKVVQQYDYESMRLQETTHQLSRTKYSLKLARQSLHRARHALALRAIDVYQEQNTDANSTVAILFQATSIQDMVNRVEAAQRISDHDAEVVKQVTTLRNRTAVQAAKLQRIQSRQKALLGQMANEKSSIESQIAERKAYVKKVKNEIAALEEEQRREAEIAREEAQRRVATWQANPPTPVVTGPVAPSSVGTAVVQAAMTRLGDWYAWGASGPTEFDCSGLVVWAFAQVGISLPHYSYSLMAGGVPVSYDQLEPGDLVFFYGGSHVGIYVGGGQFIHAPHTGTVVQINTLAGYGGGMTAARRYGT